MSSKNESAVIDRSNEEAHLPLEQTLMGLPDDGLIRVGVKIHLPGWRVLEKKSAMAKEIPDAE
jgi:hypothetical protein